MNFTYAAHDLLWSTFAFFLFRSAPAVLTEPFTFSNFVIVCVFFLVMFCHGRHFSYSIHYSSFFVTFIIRAVTFYRRHFFRLLRGTPENFRHRLCLILRRLWFPREVPLYLLLHLNSDLFTDGIFGGLAGTIVSLLFIVPPLNKNYLLQSSASTSGYQPSYYSLNISK